jgi:hypothetical protein
MGKSTALLGTALACILAAVPLADAAPPTLAGTWRRLPPAPEAAAMHERVGVWTGRELLVFGRSGTPGAMRNVAFSYDPAARRWRTLSPPRGIAGSYEGATAAVWTGTQMLVVAPAMSLSYTPATGRWRQLPQAPALGAPSGLLVWTGRELITWGGGCCGDVTSGGLAYDLATRKWRKLPKAPIAGQQRPIGAWTGRELIVLPGVDPDGKPTGGGAYDPLRDTWRTIAAPPQQRLWPMAVWDGREVLVAGGLGPRSTRSGSLATVPYAYDPAGDTWRALARIDNGSYGRKSARAVWTGEKLLVWGGQTEADDRDAIAPHGLAYDPKANRWLELPGAPLLGRSDPVAVWTGTSLLVWGGGLVIGTNTSDWWPFLDGAVFTPRP